MFDKVHIPWEFCQSVCQELGISLQPHQEAILREAQNGDVQHIMFAGGVGAAKSWLSALALLIRILAPTQNPNLVPPTREMIYWIMAGNYSTPRQTFRYVRDWLLSLFGSLKYCTMPSEGGWSMRLILPDRYGNPLCEVLVETVSGEEATRLHSVPVQMIVLSEAASISEVARNMVVGRVTRSGVVSGFIWEEGTLEGDAASSEWTRRVFDAMQNPQPNVRAYCLPSWSNRAPGSGQENLEEEDITFLEQYANALTSFNRDDPRLERLRQRCPNLYLAITTVSQPMFASRYGAVPVATGGVTFREFDYNTHVQDLHWHQGYVDMAVDVGTNDPYAILVIQEREVNGSRRLEVIDGFYKSGMTTENMIRWVLENWPHYWNTLRYLVVDPLERDARGIWAYSVLYDVIPNPAGERFKRPALYGVKTDTRLWIETIRRWLKSPATGEPRLFFDRKLTFIPYEMSRYASTPPRQGHEMQSLPRKEFDHALSALGNYLVAIYGARESSDRLVMTRRGLSFNW